MKITALELEANLLPRLKKFYTSVLGFPLISEEENYFTVAVGSSTLSFRKATKTSQEGPYHFAFNIPAGKIEEAASWLNNRAAALYQSGSATPVIQHEEWGAQALYFYDPDFNILELISHRNAPTAEGAFDATQILSIAEVGLPVPDVTGCANELKTRLQLQRWKTANDKFEAVGDEEGMFIVVEEQRPWFPTLNQAIPKPMHVTVQTGNPGTLTLGSSQVVQAV
ncbi:VOC family protein [Pontibacter ruber]|uniref:VOC family protein n=1 Tax=Pontibacter ruber TaxID=1343895 RepID=A0ABW5CXN7_9BACT|nr:VOC family protein [Pontibacter ruber]